MRKGDRVKVYCTNLADQPSSFKGEVTRVNGEQIYVRGDGYPNLEDSIVHIKQCRKLKKVGKRRIWLMSDEIEMYDEAHTNIDKSGYVEFKEVRKNK